MTRPFRLLAAANSSATSEPPSEHTPSVDSGLVVILATLLCAIICVLGLIAVARCAWIRRLSDGGSASNPASSSRPAAPANKGLKKKILKSLPKDIFSTDFSAQFSDCAICITEFVAGDEIRVLPQCGHGYHVACIDSWLGSHSSCPSCRQILVVARCHKCGGLPGPGASTSGTDTEARLKEREDDVNRSLP